jgi:hypothetical protein
MKLKKLLILLTCVVSASGAIANDYPFFTTPVGNWDFIKNELIKSCIQNEYKVKSVISEKNQILCYRDEVIYKREIERNIKLVGEPTMIGYVIDVDQWLEIEDINGNLRTVSINPETNKIYITEIFDKLRLN